MPVPSWISEMHPVEDGDDVSAQNKNRQPGELGQRTDYLKALLDAVTSGKMLVITDAAMKSDVQEGHVVYWNTTTQQFERALAAVEDDIVGGYFTLSESSFAQGIVISKSSATLGDVVLRGMVEDFDFSNTVDDVTVAGPYYLSAQTPGMLVRQSPPVSIYMGFLDGNENAFIQPSPKDPLESHVHYRFELTAAPAGVPNDPGPGETHQITVPDASAAGWLPISSYPGTPPSGARFYYNIDVDADLAGCFPPIPPESAAVARYYSAAGSRFAPGDDLLTSGTCPMVTITADGIFWNNDSYGCAPWYVDYGEESSPGEDECPEMTLMLWFTRMTFKTDQSVVTSVQPATGSPVTVTDIDGETATKGNVYLDIDMQASEGDADNMLQTKAFSEVSSLLFKKSYVVAALRSLSSYLTLSGGSTVVVDDKTYRVGAVNLDLSLGTAADREITPAVVALDDVIQRQYQDVLYLGFQSGRSSDIRLKVNLPVALPDNPQMTVKLLVLGRVNGTLPDLTCSYRRIPEADAECTAQALPVADTNLADIDLSSCGAITADQYISISSSSFTVASGDVVFITLGRGAVDAYAGELGLLRVSCEVTGS